MQNILVYLVQTVIGINCKLKAGEDLQPPKSPARYTPAGEK